MGTNYYYQPPLQDVCGHCGRGDQSGEELHIGKSSVGWCFSLHVHPELGLRTFEDWQRELAKPGARVRDEYGSQIPVERLLRVITERSFKGQPPARHALDNYCAGHGEGTWDYIVGEFS